MTSDQWRDLAAYYLTSASLPFGKWPRGDGDRSDWRYKLADWRYKNANSVDNWSA